ncbi:hypothetical protein ABT364_19630 [Massilia sp. SR12]
MANQKRKIDSYSIPLPYTPEDAARIRRTGQLQHVPVIPRPENETGFYLADLTGNPILSWPPALPKYDPRGHRSAGSFVHWKKAQDSKVGIPGNYFSFKGGGLIPCHSALEYRHLSHFEMNPFVVEIRTQYAEWRSSLYREYERQGMRMPKRALMTIDFLLTLKIPGRADFHYHAVSTKPYELLTDPKVQSRHRREVASLAVWGCTHEVMTQHSVTDMEAINNCRLFEYMREVKDIGCYAKLASDMATALLNDPTVRTCDQKIGSVARQFGWTLNEGYRVFAIANFLGYITLNHEYELILDKPLVVLARARENLIGK